MSCGLPSSTGDRCAIRVCYKLVFTVHEEKRRKKTYSVDVGVGETVEGRRYTLTSLLVPILIFGLLGLAKRTCRIHSNSVPSHRNNPVIPS